MVSYFLVCSFLADKWTSTQNDFAAGSAGLMSPIAVECCTENSRPRVDPIRTEPLIPAVLEILSHRRAVGRKNEAVHVRWFKGYHISRTQLRLVQGIGC